MREQAHLEAISGSRLRNELMSLLGDSRPWISPASLRVADTRSHPSGSAMGRASSHMARQWEGLPRPQRLKRLLVVLAAGVRPQAASSLCERLALSKRAGPVRQATEFVAQSWRRAASLLLTVRFGCESSIPWWSPRSLTSFFRGVRRAEKGRGCEATGCGGRFEAMGVAEGPTIGRLLDSLLRARLAGTVRSRSDEPVLARTLIAPKRT